MAAACRPYFAVIEALLTCRTPALPGFCLASGRRTVVYPEEAGFMRIAQIAPLTEAIPPKLYGGTERVVSWLTEELVALGHDVTLFASGDSCDVGQARADVAARAAPRRFGARSHGAAHGDAGAGAPPRRRVRRAAFSSRLLSVLGVLAPADAVRHHACMAGSTCRSTRRCSTRSPSVPVDLDFRTPSAGRCRRRAGSGRSITACRRGLLTTARR